MRSRLTPAHYLDAAVFAREQERVFRRLWIFAALRGALAEPDAFATREIGGVPVLLQNCDGEIRAFENLCPHRQMPLQADAFGQARMVCPYHGWVFDDEGRVKTIPHERRLYAYPPAERAALGLARYAVHEVGPFVFVNLADDPMPFDAQFDAGIQAKLREIGAHLGDVAIHAELPARYNWKLNYENVLDHHHVAYIHPKSFLPLLRAGAASAEDEASPAPGDTAATAADEPAGDLAAQSHWTRSPIRIEPFPWHATVDRFADAPPPDTADPGLGHYHNVFLYPNVNLVSLGGLTFLVQQFHPLAPDRTEVRFTLAAARATRRLPALPAILWGHLKSEVAVLHEDVAHLEALQARLHVAAPPARHGRYEYRLVDAAAAYLRLMEAAA